SPRSKSHREPAAADRRIAAGGATGDRRVRRQARIELEGDRDTRASSAQRRLRRGTPGHGAARERGWTAPADGRVVGAAAARRPERPLAALSIAALRARGPAGVPTPRPPRRALGAKPPA